MLLETILAIVIGSIVLFTIELPKMFSPSCKEVFLEHVD